MAVPPCRARACRALRVQVIFLVFFSHLLALPGIVRGGGQLGVSVGSTGKGMPLALFTPGAFLALTICPFLYHSSNVPVSRALALLACCRVSLLQVQR